MISWPICALAAFLSRLWDFGGTGNGKPLVFPACMTDIRLSFSDTAAGPDDPISV
jgi:hypothetical protein